jgi:hypothetical protein
VNELYSSGGEDAPDSGSAYQPGGYAERAPLRERTAPRGGDLFLSQPTEYWPDKPAAAPVKSGAKDRQDFIGTCDLWIILGGTLVFSCAIERTRERPPGNRGDGTCG